MALTKKETNFQAYDGVNYTAVFTPEIVDGKEVYEFSAKKERERDFFHYGYMTESFVEKILSIRESNGIPFSNGFILLRAPKDSNLKQKIIFDLPSEIDEESFLSVSSSEENTFTLHSKTYRNELVPSVVIKPKGSFSFQSDGADVEFALPNGEIECNNFLVSDFKKGTNNIIHLDITNSKAGDIIIEGMKPFSNKEKDAYLYIRNGENFKIDINGILPSSDISKEKKALFGNSISYIPIIANGDINIYHVELEGDLRSITSCGLISGGEIFIRNTAFKFLGMVMNKGRAILKSDKLLSFSNINLTIDGENSIKGEFYAATTDIAEQPDTLLISNLKSTSSISYENLEDSILFQPTINNSSFDFGENCLVRLQHRCTIRDTKIANDSSEEEKEIIFKDCVFSSCDFHNVSGMRNAEATFAKLEDFTFNNASLNYKSSFHFGLSPISSFTKFFTEPQYFMKNVTINLAQDQDKFDFMLDENSKAVINSCSFSGHLNWQESKNNENIESETVISNSMFNNVNFIHNLSASNKLELNKSDLSGKIIGENLKEVKNSLIKNVDFNRVESISDCFLKNYEAKNSAHTLKNFNSESGDQPTTNEGPKADATEDFEIL